MTKLPQIPMTSPTCTHLRHHGYDYGCSVLGKCEPAYADVTTLATCLKFKRAYRKGEQKPAVNREKVPPLVSLPCVHLGDDTGKMVDCPTCKGHVQLKTFVCAVHERCTIGKQAPGVQCCVGCVDRTEHGHLPLVKMTKLPTLADHYNCSLIRHHGKLLMASRLGWAGSRVFLSQLDERTLQPIWSRDLAIQHQRAAVGVEDPRLVVVGDRLHVVATAYENANEGHTSILVAKLDNDLKVQSIVVPHKEGRSKMEKNWAPFEFGGLLHFVYTVNPHVVIRMEEDKTREVGRADNIFPWRNTALRGGCGPVLVGDEWWHWFHTVNTTRKGKLVYGLGLYTFQNRPPFLPLRRCSNVILVSDVELLGWNKTVLFPCGSVLEPGGRWLISAGVNDRESRIYEFDHYEVEKRLA